PQGSGGTGYFGGSGAKVGLKDRIALDLALAPIDDPQIDVIISTMGGNDNQASLDNGTFASAVSTTIAACKYRWPNAVILFSEPLTSDTGQLTADKSTIIQAQATAAGVKFVGGIRAALAAYYAVPGNSVSDLFHGDGHPNDAGHAWFADQLNTRIRAALA
ncbi:MAG: SGNH/GDSL hydrolase family protein, partial [Pseudomonadota bacterium]